MILLSNSLPVHSSIRWLIATLLCLSASLSAATYYVTKAGNDANVCSAERPCLTLARAHAVATQAGDVVQVGAGDYNETLTITTSGASKNHITWRGHGGSGCPTEAGHPIFSVDGVRAAPTVSLRGVVVNANYITVECFHVTDTLGYGFTAKKDRTDITFGWNKTSRRSPTFMALAAGINLDHSYRGNEGVDRMPKNVHAYRNVIQGAAKAIYAYCGGNCLFEDNELYEGFYNSTGGETDYIRLFGDGATFRNNRMHSNTTANCEGCHIDCFQTYSVRRTDSLGNYYYYDYERARNMVLDGNFCTDAHQGIMASARPGESDHIKDWIVMNNVFASRPDGLKLSWCAALETTLNIRMYNNVCAKSGALWFRAGATGEAKNNIFWENGYRPLYAETGGSYAEAGNIFYDSYRTYVQSDYPNSIVNANPLFQETGSLNFQLTANSPARDVGVTISSVTRDRLGVARPQGARHDIGPYEFRATPVIIAPPSQLHSTIR